MPRIPYATIDDPSNAISTQKNEVAILKPAGATATVVI